MDADRFDTLSRTLVQSPFRRTVLRLLAGSAVGSLLGLGALAAEAKKKGKKKKKRKKRKTPAGKPCTPNCAGKTCGPDGCGGSCGPCTNGTCTGGSCSCGPGDVLCQGRCVYSCFFPADFALNPKTCQCCGAPGADCSAGNQCCSGTCLPGGNPGTCVGIGTGSDCQFDGQCSTGFCVNGTCGCPQGRQICAGGAGCSEVCESDEAIAPDHCVCCLRNGVSCAARPTGCCAGSNRCINGSCQGLDDQEDCSFDEQCISPFGCNNKKCGAAINQ
jgi:hypothetical protein